MSLPPATTNTTRDNNNNEEESQADDGEEGNALAVKLRHCDMSEMLLAKTKRIIADALSQQKSEKDLATQIKKACDEDVAFNSSSSSSSSNKPGTDKVAADRRPEMTQRRGEGRDDADKGGGGGAWHCVVGRNFACSVTCSAEMSLLLDVCDKSRPLSVLLFKSQ